MTVIERVAERDSRYTTEESRGIEMFRVDGGELLTLGQLMIAYCCRLAAAVEARSVLQMNRINRTNERMTVLADGMSAMLAASADTTFGAITVKVAGRNVNFREFLLACGVAESALVKGDVRLTEQVKLNLATPIKLQMENASATSQREGVQLRAEVNARDTAFKSAASLSGGYCGLGASLARALA